MNSSPTRLPLQGVRVLDLTRLLAGNMLSLQLADFGAEIRRRAFVPLTPSSDRLKPCSELTSSSQ